MKTQIEKKLKKYSAKQLSAKLEKSSISEVEKEVIIEILKSRGQDVSKWEEVVEKVDTNEKEVNSEDLLDSMKKEVDEFVDSLIEEKRTGVYNQVMKALGGNFDSDLDDLLEEATEQQLKEALSFRGIKKSTEQEEPVKKVEKIETVTKIKKSTKKEVTPKEQLSDYDFKVGDNVKFTPFKSDNTVKGVLKKVYLCKYTGYVYCIIKGESKTFSKRANSVNHA